jgi:uncharacterized membrane protein YeiH
MESLFSFGFLAIATSGVIVAAVSGVLAAARKGMDIIGAIIVAMVTAVGGGTTRDVLLGRYPVFWVAQPWYLAVAIGAAIVTIAYARKHAVPMRALLVVDAVALAVFAIVGAEIAIAMRAGWFVVIIMAAITGSVGGVLRDILCAEVPLLLRGEVYVSATVVGAGSYLIMLQLAVPEAVASAVAITLAAAVRLAAIVYDIRVPKVSAAARGE